MSHDSTVKLWDVTSGKGLLIHREKERSVNSVSFAPDGLRLVAATGNEDIDPIFTSRGPGEAKVWDATTGQELSTVRGHGHGLSSVTFSPDGQRIATAGGVAIPDTPGEVKVWDATTGQELVTFRGHTKAVTCVSFSRFARDWFVPA